MGRVRLSRPSGKCNILFLISRSIRSGQGWVPVQYVYLYIYLNNQKKKKHPPKKPAYWWGRASITYNAVYGYTFIYNLNMESEAFLQCAILQEGTNSILASRGCSSWCLQQAHLLHNNALPCSEMLFRRPRLISQTSPLLQFPKLLFPSLLPTRFHYVFRM